MFDIGFWELAVVATVGLLVLGPERLPGAIRTGSLWLNRLRRSFADIKRDIEREIGADELKRDLHNQRIMESLREARDHIATEVQDTQRQLDGTAGPRRDSGSEPKPTESGETSRPAASPDIGAIEPPGPPPEPDQPPAPARHPPHL